VVAFTTLGVQDPKLRSAAGRAVARPRDERLRPLADDVAAEPDPALAMELQPKAGRFRHGGGEAAGEPRRLEDDEECLGATSEGRQTSEPVGDLRRGRPGIRARRKVDDEDIDGAGSEEHPADGQPLIERLRREDDEPVQADSPGRCLDGIQRPGEVQPGNDRAVRLRLGNQMEGDRRRAGRRRAVHRNAGAPRQAARTDDGIERREAGPDDPLDASSRLARRGRDRNELGWERGRLDRQRRRGERPDHPGSCGTPPRLERRQSRRHVRGEARHRTVSIEHPFDIVNGKKPSPAAPAYGFGWTTARTFRLGSMNHAAHE
jgi:hypothetical protein